MQLYTFLVFFILNFFLLLFCKKFSLIQDKKNDSHKKFISSTNSYSIGGFVILFYFIFYFWGVNNQTYLIFLTLFFLIGLLSDIKVFNDPKIRFFIQAFFLLIFVSILDITIIDTRIIFFNGFLSYSYFNKFFVVFCLMVLINGSNFIDGLNTIFINYYLTIFFIIILFFHNNFLDIVMVENLIIVLISILLFNIFSYIFLGDSGAYLLSLFTGVLLIKFVQANQDVSPYFVILLLWYPCFELLFSIIRRNFSKKKTYEPDNKHLHQLMFLFLKKYLIKKIIVTQFVVSLIINIFNFLTFLLGCKFYNHTIALIFIIIFNMIMYIILYVWLSRNLGFANS